MQTAPTASQVFRIPFLALCISLCGLSVRASFPPPSDADRFGYSLDALAYYIEMASYPDPDIRLRAMEEIRRLGRHAVPARRKLLEILRDDPDARMRAAAAEALMVIKTPEAASGLIQALDDSDREVRFFAASGLGFLGTNGAEGVDRLATIAKDDFTNVRVVAIRALGCIGEGAFSSVPVLVQILEDKNPDLSVEAAASLGAIGPTARDSVPSLMNTLRRGIDEGARAARRIENADEITPGSESFLTLDASANLTAAAILGICGMGPAAQGAIPLLRETQQTLNDPAFHTRNFRFEGARRLLDWALLSIQQNSDAPVENVAKDWLRRRGGYPDPLYLMTNREIWNDSKQFTESDIQVFNSKQVQLPRRDILGRVLENNSTKEALAQSLIQLIRGLSEQEVTHAFAALCKLGPAASIVTDELLEMLNDERLEYGAVAALGHIGPSASKAAEKVLALKDVNRKGWGFRLGLADIYWAYAQILGEEKGMEYLHAIVLNGNNNDASQRAEARMAITALGTIKGDDSNRVKALAKIATDELMKPELRRMAADCLQQLGPKAQEALPDLITGLDGLQNFKEREYDPQFAREQQPAIDERYYADLGPAPIGRIIPVFGAIGPAASEAIPKLREALIWRTGKGWSGRTSGGNWASQSAELAAEALTRIDPDDYFFHYSITGRGPASQRTVTFLKEVLDDPAQSEWHASAMEVVYQVGYELQSRELDGWQGHSEYLSWEAKFERVPYDVTPLIPTLKHQLEVGEKLVQLRAMGFYHWNNELVISAIPALVALLESEDPDIRKGAAETLGEVALSLDGVTRISDTDIVRLAAVIESGEPMVQEAAFEVLGRAGGNSEAVAELLGRYLDDEDSNRRQWASEALATSWRTGCDRVELIIRAIEHSNLNTRTPLIGAMARMSAECDDPRFADVMLTVLSDTNALTEERIAAIRGAIRLKSVPTELSVRLQRILGEDPSSELTEEVNRALANLEEQRVPKTKLEELIEEYKSYYNQKYGPNIGVAISIAELGPEATSAVPMLLEDLSKIEWYRGYPEGGISGELEAQLLAEAIYKIAPERSEPLQTFLRASQVWDRKSGERARRMLKKINASSTPLLLEAAKNEEYSAWVCNKVAEFGPSDIGVADHFQESLKHEFPAVRKASIIGLSRVARDQPETIPSITAMLDDSDLWVRLAAVGALDFIRAEMTSSIATLEKIASSGARSDTLAVIETLSAMHAIPDGADRLLNDWTTHEDDDIRNSARDAIRHHGRLN